jgi:hypothetical protein
LHTGLSSFFVTGFFIIGTRLTNASSDSLKIFIEANFGFFVWRKKGPFIPSASRVVHIS